MPVNLLMAVPMVPLARHCRAPALLLTVKAVGGPHLRGGEVEAHRRFVARFTTVDSMPTA